MSTQKAQSEYPRYFMDAELRVVDGANGRPKLVGYAATFNTPSVDLGGFKEVFAPGAFTDVLASNEEVLAMVEHEPGKILGRRSAGTLTLSEDDRGLRVEIDPPDTTVGRDAVENVRRRDIVGMSIRFPKGAKDGWHRDADGGSVRTIRKAGLLEVTLTSIPAYPSTSVSLRSLPDGEDAETRAYYRKSIEALNPKPETPVVNTPNLNLAEKRLQLLTGEKRCCGDYNVVAVKEDPADCVRYALYSCRSAFDSATSAMGKMEKLEGDVPADYARACSDAAAEADRAVARLTEFAAACRAKAVGGGGEPAPAADPAE